MALGGARPGAGRPKGGKASHTVEAERGKAYIVEQYIKHLAPMLKAQIAQAKRGNVKAFDVLSERALGRVPQGLMNDNGIPFIVQIAQAVAEKNDTHTGSGADSA